MTSVTSALLVAILTAGSTSACEARVYAEPASAGQDLAAPQAPLPNLSLLPPTAALEGLPSRAQDAVAQAADQGAQVTVLVLDRTTGQQVAAGSPRALATASVAKLFIADDLLQRDPALDGDDLAKLRQMLRSSDDNAAEEFWNRNGGDQIIGRVAARYGLGSTFGPPNGRWWNTLTTAGDLVRYYDMLLRGAGGLSRERGDIIIGALARSTPNGLDGYPQRFGVPDGLYGEQVAVKQGWMCCIGADWMHLSTGVVGADRRYVVVVYSLQAGDDFAARETVTDVVKTMFPGGKI
ncbi:hypothetical protein H7I02_14075 [Mycolicibacterium brumae]|nr:hypothetical protein [Mycolicibacterium brumae]RWA21831.1 hypothetical protein MBRU_14095 [Mycolicibacterium brumae DSM 44177]